MSLPIQITWRGIEPSAALESRIRQLAERLGKFTSQPVRCRVIIEFAHKHGHQGNLYEVHVLITAPGTEIIARREHRGALSHEDPYVAVRDAFRAARRQLADYERERRAGRHPPASMGAVREPN